MGGSGRESGGGRYLYHLCVGKNKFVRKLTMEKETPPSANTIELKVISHCRQILNRAMGLLTPIYFVFHVCKCVCVNKRARACVSE